MYRNYLMLVFFSVEYPFLGLLFFFFQKYFVSTRGSSECVVGLSGMVDRHQISHQFCSVTLSTLVTSFGTPLYYCPLVIVFYLILNMLISLDLPMDRGDLDVHS